MAQPTESGYTIAGGLLDTPTKKTSTTLADAGLGSATLPLPLVTPHALSPPALPPPSQPQSIPLGLPLPRHGGAVTSPILPTAATLPRPPVAVAGGSDASSPVLAGGLLSDTAPCAPGTLGGALAPPLAGGLLAGSVGAADNTTAAFPVPVSAPSPVALAGSLLSDRVPSPTLGSSARSATNTTVASTLAGGLLGAAPSAAALPSPLGSMPTAPPVLAGGLLGGDLASPVTAVAPQTRATTLAGGLLSDDSSPAPVLDEAPAAASAATTSPPSSLLALPPVAGLLTSSGIPIMPPMGSGTAEGAHRNHGPTAAGYAIAGGLLATPPRSPRLDSRDRSAIHDLQTVNDHEKVEAGESFRDTHGMSTKTTPPLSTTATVPAASEEVESKGENPTVNLSVSRPNEAEQQNHPSTSSCAGVAGLPPPVDVNVAGPDDEHVDDDHGSAASSPSSRRSDAAVDLYRHADVVAVDLDDRRTDNAEGRSPQQHLRNDSDGENAAPLLLEKAATESQCSVTEGTVGFKPSAGSASASVRQRHAENDGAAAGSGVLESSNNGGAVKSEDRRPSASFASGDPTAARVVPVDEWTPDQSMCSSSRLATSGEAGADGVQRQGQQHQEEKQQQHDQQQADDGEDQLQNDDRRVSADRPAEAQAACGLSAGSGGASEGPEGRSAVSSPTLARRTTAVFPTAAADATADAASAAASGSSALLQTGPGGAAASNSTTSKNSAHRGSLSGREADAEGHGAEGKETSQESGGLLSPLPCFDPLQVTTSIRDGTAALSNVSGPAQESKKDEAGEDGEAEEKADVKCDAEKHDASPRSRHPMPHEEPTAGQSARRVADVLIPSPHGCPALLAPLPEHAGESLNADSEGAIRQRESQDDGELEQTSNDGEADGAEPLRLDSLQPMSLGPMRFVPTLTVSPKVGAVVASDSPAADTSSVAASDPSCEAVVGRSDNGHNDDSRSHVSSQDLGGHGNSRTHSLPRPVSGGGGGESDPTSNGRSGTNGSPGILSSDLNTVHSRRAVAAGHGGGSGSRGTSPGGARQPSLPLSQRSQSTTGNNGGTGSVAGGRAAARFDSSLPQPRRTTLLLGSVGSINSGAGDGVPIPRQLSSVPASRGSSYRGVAPLVRQLSTITVSSMSQATGVGAGVGTPVARQGSCPPVRAAPSMIVSGSDTASVEMSLLRCEPTTTNHADAEEVAASTSSPLLVTSSSGVSGNAAKTTVRETAASPPAVTDETSAAESKETGSPDPDVTSAVAATSSDPGATRLTLELPAPLDASNRSINREEVLGPAPDDSSPTRQNSPQPLRGYTGIPIVPRECADPQQSTAHRHRRTFPRSATITLAATSAAPSAGSVPGGLSVSTLTHASPLSSITTPGVGAQSASYVGAFDVSNSTIPLTGSLSQLSAPTVAGSQRFLSMPPGMSQMTGLSVSGLSGSGSGNTPLYTPHDAMGHRRGDRLHFSMMPIASAGSWAPGMSAGRLGIRGGNLHSAGAASMTSSIGPAPMSVRQDSGALTPLTTEDGTFVSVAADGDHVSLSPGGITTSLSLSTERERDRDRDRFVVDAAGALITPSISGGFNGESTAALTGRSMQSQSQSQGATTSGATPRLLDGRDGSPATVDVVGTATPAAGATPPLIPDVTDAVTVSSQTNPSLPPQSRHMSMTPQRSLLPGQRPDMDPRVSPLANAANVRAESEPALTQATDDHRDSKREQDGGASVKTDPENERNGDAGNAEVDPATAASQGDVPAEPATVTAQTSFAPGASRAAVAASGTTDRSCPPQPRQVSECIASGKVGSGASSSPGAAAETEPAEATATQPQVSTQPQASTQPGAMTPRTALSIAEVSRALRRSNRRKIRDEIMATMRGGGGGSGVPGSLTPPARTAWPSRYLSIPPPGSVSEPPPRAASAPRADARRQADAGASDGRVFSLPPLTSLMSSDAPSNSGPNAPQQRVGTASGAGGVTSTPGKTAPRRERAPVPLSPARNGNTAPRPTLPLLPKAGDATATEPSVADANVLPLPSYSAMEASASQASGGGGGSSSTTSLARHGAAAALVASPVAVSCGALSGVGSSRSVQDSLIDDGSGRMIPGLPSRESMMLSPPVAGLPTTAELMRSQSGGSAAAFSAIGVSGGVSGGGLGFDSSLRTSVGGGRAPSTHTGTSSDVMSTSGASLPFPPFMSSGPAAALSGLPMSGYASECSSTTPFGLPRLSGAGGIPPLSFTPTSLPINGPYGSEAGTSVLGHTVSGLPNQASHVSTQQSHAVMSNQVSYQLSNQMQMSHQFSQHSSAGSRRSVRSNASSTAPILPTPAEVWRQHYVPPAPTSQVSHASQAASLTTLGGGLGGVGGSIGGSVGVGALGSITGGVAATTGTLSVAATISGSASTAPPIAPLSTIGGAASIVSSIGPTTGLLPPGLPAAPVPGRLSSAVADELPLLVPTHGSKPPLLPVSASALSATSAFGTGAVNMTAGLPTPAPGPMSRLPSGAGGGSLAHMSLRTTGGVDGGSRHISVADRDNDLSGPDQPRIPPGAEEPNDTSRVPTVIVAGNGDDEDDTVVAAPAEDQVSPKAVCSDPEVPAPSSAHALPGSMPTAASFDASSQNAQNSDAGNCSAQTPGGGGSVTGSKEGHGRKLTKEEKMAQHIAHRAAQQVAKRERLRLKKMAQLEERAVEKAQRAARRAELSASGAASAAGASAGVSGAASLATCPTKEGSAAAGVSGNAPAKVTAASKQPASVIDCSSSAPVIAAAAVATSKAPIEKTKRLRKVKGKPSASTSTAASLSPPPEIGGRRASCDGAASSTAAKSTADVGVGVAGGVAEGGSTDDPSSEIVVLLRLREQKRQELRDIERRLLECQLRSKRADGLLIDTHFTSTPTTTPTAATTNTNPTQSTTPTAGPDGRAHLLGNGPHGLHGPAGIVVSPRGIASASVGSQGTALTSVGSGAMLAASSAATTSAGTVTPFEQAAAGAGIGGGLLDHQPPQARVVSPTNEHGDLANSAHTTGAAGASTGTGGAPTTATQASPTSSPLGFVLPRAQYVAVDPDTPGPDAAAPPAAGFSARIPTVAPRKKKTKPADEEKARGEKARQSPDGTSAAVTTRVAHSRDAHTRGGDGRHAEPKQTTTSSHKQEEHQQQHQREPPHAQALQVQPQQGQQTDPAVAARLLRAASLPPMAPTSRTTSGAPGVGAAHASVSTNDSTQAQVGGSGLPLYGLNRRSTSPQARQQHPSLSPVPSPASHSFVSQREASHTPIAKTKTTPGKEGLCGGTSLSKEKDDQPLLSLPNRSTTSNTTGSASASSLSESGRRAAAAAVAAAAVAASSPPIPSLTAAGAPSPSSHATGGGGAPAAPQLPRCHSARTPSSPVMRVASNTAGVLSTSSYDSDRERAAALFGPVGAGSIGAGSVGAGSVGAGSAASFSGGGGGGGGGTRADLFGAELKSDGSGSFNQQVSASASPGEVGPSTGSAVGVAASSSEQFGSAALNDELVIRPASATNAATMSQDQHEGPSRGESGSESFSVGGGPNANNTDGAQGASRTAVLQQLMGAPQQPSISSMQGTDRTMSLHGSIATTGLLSCHPQSSLHSAMVGSASSTLPVVHTPVSAGLSRTPADRHRMSLSVGRTDSSVSLLAKAESPTGLSGPQALPLSAANAVGPGGRWYSSGMGSSGLASNAGGGGGASRSGSGGGDGTGHGTDGSGSGSAGAVRRREPVASSAVATAADAVPNVTSGSGVASGPSMMPESVGEAGAVDEASMGLHSAQSSLLAKPQMLPSQPPMSSARHFSIQSNVSAGEFTVSLSPTASQEQRQLSTFSSALPVLVSSTPLSRQWSAYPLPQVAGAGSSTPASAQHSMVLARAALFSSPSVGPTAPLAPLAVSVAASSSTAEMAPRSGSAKGNADTTLGPVPVQEDAHHVQHDDDEHHGHNDGLNPQEEHAVLDKKPHAAASTIADSGPRSHNSGDGDHAAGLIPHFQAEEVSCAQDRVGEQIGDSLQADAVGSTPEHDSRHDATAGAPKRRTTSEAPQSDDHHSADRHCHFGLQSAECVQPSGQALQPQISIGLSSGSASAATPSGPPPPQQSVGSTVSPSSSIVTTVTVTGSAPSGVGAGMGAAVPPVNHQQVFGASAPSQIRPQQQAQDHHLPAQAQPVLGQLPGHSVRPGYGGSQGAVPPIAVPVQNQPVGAWPQRAAMDHDSHNSSAHQFPEFQASSGHQQMRPTDRNQAAVHAQQQQFNDVPHHLQGPNQNRAAVVQGQGQQNREWLPQPPLPTDHWIGAQPAVSSVSGFPQQPLTTGAYKTQADGRGRQAFMGPGHTNFGADSPQLPSAGVSLGASFSASMYDGPVAGQPPQHHQHFQHQLQQRQQPQQQYQHPLVPQQQQEHQPQWASSEAWVQPSSAPSTMQGQQQPQLPPHHPQQQSFAHYQQSLPSQQQVTTHPHQQQSQQLPQWQGSAGGPMPEASTSGEWRSGHTTGSWSRHGSADGTATVSVAAPFTAPAPPPPHYPQHVQQKPPQQQQLQQGNDINHNTHTISAPLPQMAAPTLTPGFGGPLPAPPAALLATASPEQIAHIRLVQQQQQQQQQLQQRQMQHGGAVGVVGGMVQSSAGHQPHLQIQGASTAMAVSAAVPEIDSRLAAVYGVPRCVARCLPPPPNIRTVCSVSSTRVTLLITGLARCQTGGTHGGYLLLPPALAPLLGRGDVNTSAGAAAVSAQSTTAVSSPDMKDNVLIPFDAELVLRRQLGAVFLAAGHVWGDCVVRYRSKEAKDRAKHHGNASHPHGTDTVSASAAGTAAPPMLSTVGSEFLNVFLDFENYREPALVMHAALTIALACSGVPVPTTLVHAFYRPIFEAAGIHACDDGTIGAQRRCMLGQVCAATLQTITATFNQTHSDPSSLGTTQRSLSSEHAHDAESASPPTPGMSPLSFQPSPPEVNQATDVLAAAAETRRWGLRARFVPSRNDPPQSLELLNKLLDAAAATEAAIEQEVIGLHHAAPSSPAAPNAIIDPARRFLATANGQPQSHSSISTPNGAAEAAAETLISELCSTVTFAGSSADALSIVHGELAARPGHNLVGGGGGALQPQGVVQGDDGAVLLALVKRRVKLCVAVLDLVREIAAVGAAAVDDRAFLDQWRVQV